jgi:hypothetical protein
MKFKGFGLGIVLLGFFFLQTFSQQVQRPAQAQVKPDQLVRQMILSEKIDKRWPALTKLAEQIIVDNEALQASFQKRDFWAMADLFGKRHGVVSSRDYEIIYGGDSEGFWRTVWSEGATLDIRTAMVYVSNVLGPRPGPIISRDKMGKLSFREGTFDAVAFVAQEIHVISKTKAGAVLHNDTYFCDLGYRHQDTCHWGE